MVLTAVHGSPLQYMCRITEEYVCVFYVCVFVCTGLFINYIITAEHMVLFDKVGREADLQNKFLGFT